VCLCGGGFVWLCGGVWVGACVGGGGVRG